MNSNSSDLVALKALAEELESVDSIDSAIASRTNSIIRAEADIKKWEIPLHSNLSDSNLFDYGCNHNTSNGLDRQVKCMEESNQLYWKRDTNRSRFFGITILIAVLAFLGAGFASALAHPDAQETFGFSITEAQLTSMTPILSGCIVASWVLIFIAWCFKRMNRSGKLTRKQKAWIKEGERLDLENKQKNLAEIRAKAPGIIHEKKQRIQELESAIQELEADRREHEHRIHNMHVLAEQDKDLNTVLFLIKQMESRRANSVTEALHQYDAKQQEASRIRFAYEQEKLRRDMEAMQRARDAEDRLNQAWHNMEMEKQARKAVKEIEEMRKDAEYYRRYGNS